MNALIEELENLTADWYAGTIETEEYVAKVSRITAQLKWEAK